MPNVMAALPNRGGALCSKPQNLADSHYRVPCSNAAKTRNPLKFAGMSQTLQQISAASGPKFAILWRYVEEVLLFKNFFFDCRYMPQLRRYRITNLCDAAEVAIFCVIFAFCISSEPRAAHFRPAF